MKRKSLDEAAALLRDRAGGAIDCAVVLGSGMGHVFAGRIDAKPIAYKKLAGMPEPSVPGHAGEVTIGELHGRMIAVFSGRFHLYEGYDGRQVIYPIAIAAHAGARTIVLTNAAGGLNHDFRPGDLMMLDDHINLTGANPLAGPLLHNTHTRFVDMIDCYSVQLRELARHIASEYAIVMHTGTYAAVPGPSYETQAEAKALRQLGADAVGMSTVLETIAARALGCDVAAFSLITNILNGAPTTHEEVLAVSKRGSENVAKLIEGIVANLELPPAPLV